MTNTSTDPYRTRLFDAARRGWPALAVSALLLIVCGSLIARSLDYNDGVLVYALDDAYIHMSIARNFVEHGVWGITPHAYSSTSSSPLWTLLIAISYLPGVNEITPLLLNLALGVAVVFAAERLLRRLSVPALVRLAALALMVVLTPLETLVLTGMEHVLQILLALLFLDAGTRLLAEPPPLASWDWGRLALLGMLTGTARYEGLFLVLIFCGFFALRGRWLHGFSLGALSIVPVIVYGLIGVANGWDFLPASLMTKSDAGYLSSAGIPALFTYFVVDTYHILGSQHVLLLPVLAALGLYLFRFYRDGRAWDSAPALLLAFVLLTLINVRLVSWPWAGTFARYEAWLLALVPLVLAAGLGADLPRRFAWRALPAYAVALLLALFVMRDVVQRYQFVAFDNPAVTATRDIYNQQMQMARFLAAYYDSAVVAANDIGAINFFTNIDNVDLWGLGSIEVARAITENRYHTDAIRQIASDRAAEIAIVYETWFEQYGGLPPEWTRVGRWRVAHDPAILGSDTVTFFAVDPAAAEPLAANLRAFSASLPANVIESGPYVDGDQPAASAESDGNSTEAIITSANRNTPMADNQ